MQRISFSLSPTTSTITFISNHHQNISLVVPLNHTLQTYPPNIKPQRILHIFPWPQQVKHGKAPICRQKISPTCCQELLNFAHVEVGTVLQWQGGYWRLRYRGSTVGDCLNHQIIHLDPFRRKWMVMFMCVKSSVCGGLSAHLVNIYILNHPCSCRI